MSIRIKLLLSYTGMLLVSLLVFALTASLFTIAATGIFTASGISIKCIISSTR